MNNPREKKLGTSSLCRKGTLASFSLLLILLVNMGCQNRSDLKQEVTNEPKKPPVIKEKWHWDRPEKQSESAGYAQAVKVGNTIYLSGIPTSDLSPEGIAKLYRALEQSLNAFGASPKDVVKETLYTTDIEAMKKYNDVRKEFYQGDYPAASWVQIDRLYEPNAKLEVDLIAVLTDNKN